MARGGTAAGAPSTRSRRAAPRVSPDHRGTPASVPPSVAGSLRGPCYCGRRCTGSRSLWTVGWARLCHPLRGAHGAPGRTVGGARGTSSGCRTRLAQCSTCLAARRQCAPCGHVDHNDERGGARAVPDGWVRSQRGAQRSPAGCRRDPGGVRGHAGYEVVALPTSTDVTVAAMSSPWDGFRCGRGASEQTPG